ncbi:carboxyl transferase domain-containing protein [Haloechinothrix halophila]|uniref:carboxyl transferase domain-containing protein n=1 Tax=Haloechinothrix halophila TaxID=1069073 RepID=UPI000402531F|nr:carboxyl transferase domain-containing protein [Haloechinothrix halophila]
MTDRIGAHRLIERVVDTDSFESWDAPVDVSGHDADYASALRKASERAGTDEAVVTGCATIGGRDVALIVSEFEFLGGSIGRATARRIVAAVNRATERRLPLLAAPRSGGTRMQEGTPAFVRMVSITRAILAHKAAGLPYLVYLRDPTTGGVFASWGSLGHITVAEPGALIGFLGPRVYEALHGTPFPPGVQTAENLADNGIIDAVVAIDELAALATRALRLLTSPESGDTTDPPPSASSPREHLATPWDSVRRTRRDDRPGVTDLLRNATDDVLRLRGTGAGDRDDGLVLALASLHGIHCVLIGHDRHHQRHTPLGPAAMRQAQRGMRLAEDLRLPLVAIIDTPGADLSPAAEEGALAGEIAQCVATITALTVPTVSVLLGQGCGGAALALLPTDRVIAAEHAWLSALPLEGASAIVHRDTDHAAEMATRQHITAPDLLAEGIVHHIVAEPPDAARDVRGFTRTIVAACAKQIRELRTIPSGS